VNANQNSDGGATSNHYPCATRKIKNLEFGTRIRQKLLEKKFD